MNKTVLITGASSGFGKEAARLFRQRGWNVAATMRAPEAAGSWAAPAGIFTARLDVTDRDSIREAVAATMERFGAVDALVNNAGFALMGPLEGASPRDLRRQFDTNLIGLIETTQAVLPAMRAAGRGTIVNISSMGGRITFPLFSAYHATKFAVEGLSESLRYELRPFGIRVRLVEPGGSRTNFGGSSMVATRHPAYEALLRGSEAIMGQQMEKAPGPERVAETIVIAASDKSERLRYPVIATLPLLARKLVGFGGWTLLMNQLVRDATKKGQAELAGG